MNLRASISDVAGTRVLALEGSIDLATLPVLHNELAKALLDHTRVVAIDLGGVDSLDDVGLGILLGAAGTARRSGGDVVLVTTNPRFLERFALTGLDRAITVTPSLSAVSGERP